MTREIHYPLMILSILTGALAAFVAMATVLSTGSALTRDPCALGGSATVLERAVGHGDCRAGWQPLGN